MASSASIVYGEVLEAVLSPKHISYELVQMPASGLKERARTFFPAMR